MKYILLAVMLLTSAVNAVDLGMIKKIEGKAKVQHDKSFKKNKLTVNATIKAGDTILTYKNSKVVIELNDKTKIVLDAYAKLTLVSTNEYIQNGGKIFFKVTKRKGAKGLKVKTPFAIIGVKGTEFVVTDSATTKGLALNEGLVGLDSTDGKGFSHVDGDKVNAQMPQTPASVNAEFEAYKAKLYKEFAEFKRSFDLKPGKKLVFNGNQVVETSQNSGDQQMFKGYMSDAEFKAISNELEKDVTGTPDTMDNAFESDFFSDDI